MSRILAVDYGCKRVGIAVSDPLKIIASPLVTIETGNLFNFLKNYFIENQIEKIVIGYPKKLNNKPANITEEIDTVIKYLNTNYPKIEIVKFDERFTSKIAFNAMIESGISKKKRQDKALIDKIAATLILEDYLERLNNSNS